MSLIAFYYAQVSPTRLLAITPRRMGPTRSFHRCSIRRNARVKPGDAKAPDAFIEPSGVIDGVKYLSLNRPQSKNAISRKLLQEMQLSLDIAEFDKDLRVLIVRSTTPGSFCAGADLIERRTMTRE